MRNHLVGIGLLLVLGAAIWGTARLAAPAVGDAFVTEGGDDTGTTEDVIDLTASSTAPLTVEEAVDLQRFLWLEGHDTGGADGIIGAMTREAIDQTIEARGLDPATTPRELLEFLTTVWNGPELGDDLTEDDTGDPATGADPDLERIGEVSTTDTEVVDP